MPGRLLPSEYRRRLNAEVWPHGKERFQPWRLNLTKRACRLTTRVACLQIPLTKSATVSGKGLQWRTICPFTSGLFAYAETNCSSRHARGIVAIRAQSHEERLCALLEIPGRGGNPYGVRRDLRRM
jgi:hypothetical protein